MRTDRERTREHSALAALIWWVLLGLLAGLLVLGDYFVMPKLQHAWAQQGGRPPLWGLALLSASKLVSRWGYVLLLLVPLALFLWPRPRPPAEPRE